MPTIGRLRVFWIATIVLGFVFPFERCAAKWVNRESVCYFQAVPGGPSIEVRGLDWDPRIAWPHKRTLFSFVVIADIHSSYGMTGGAVREYVNKYRFLHNIEFVVLLGDLTDKGRGGLGCNFDLALRSPLDQGGHKTYMHSADFELEDVLSELNVPWFAVMGNHDIHFERYEGTPEEPSEEVLQDYYPPPGYRCEDYFQEAYHNKYPLTGGGSRWSTDGDGNPCGMYSATRTYVNPSGETISDTYHFTNVEKGDVGVESN
jgi:hypothetical protein